MLQFPKPVSKKKKSKHKTNERIKDYTPCDECGERATETHEVFHDGTSHTRNLCIDNEWQEKLCNKCHSEIHRGNGELDRKIKRKWQHKIMQQMFWDVDLWRSETHLKNYLEE